MRHLTAIALILLAGCATCGTFREATPTGYQLAELCFTDHAALKAAVATGHLDTSKVSTHSVCAKSAQPFPEGATCPQAK